MESQVIDITSELKAIDAKVPKYYYDGKSFWMQNDEGIWVSLNQDQFRRELRFQGYDWRTPKGESVSEIDRIIRAATVNNRISWAGVLAGHWAGLKKINHSRILITQDPILIPPIDPPADAPKLDTGDAFGDSAGWPTVGVVFRNLFKCPKTGDEQLVRFFSYLKSTMDCLYNKRWGKAPTLAIAGEINCGKTLLLTLIRHLFGGQEGQPYNWMIGRESFNGDLTKAVLLTIDDEVTDKSPTARSDLGDRLKKICATDLQWIRGMHKEALLLKPLWRPIICCNNEPDKLLAIPLIEFDNIDKLIILKAYFHPMPMPANTPEEQEIFERQLLSELPHFVYWLLNEFEIPLEKRGRFGVQAWQHPEILENLHSLSPEHQIWYFIQKVIFNGPNIENADPVTAEPLGFKEWGGSSEDLYAYLTDTRVEDRPTLTMEEARSVPKPGWLGRRLKKLMHKYPSQVFRKHTETGNYWYLSPNQEETENEEVSF